MSTHGSPTTRRFVRTAWIMLAFQLLAAGGAVGAAVWAFLEVRNIVNDRANLQARVTELEAAQNQTAPAPEPEPVTERVETPIEEPVAPPVEDAPSTTGPTRPPPVTRPPVRQPPGTPPPVYTPPANDPPVYDEPDLPPSAPPPYSTPPRTNDQPAYDPPRERPRPRPRPQGPSLNIPGIIGDILTNGTNRPPRRPQTNDPLRQPNPTRPPTSRPPGTTNPNNQRPPATTSNPTRPPRTTNTINNTVRRRPRPQTDGQQQPVVN